MKVNVLSHGIYDHLREVVWGVKSYHFFQCVWFPKEPCGFVRFRQTYLHSSNLVESVTQKAARDDLRQTDGETSNEKGRRRGESGRIPEGIGNPIAEASPNANENV